MTKIQLRRGSAGQWSANNPVLSDGEPGFEHDTGRLKIGDGVTAWNTLGYQGVPRGVPFVRQFPFSFDTPNILTGAALYTPSTGDLILHATVRVLEGWDGTTPHADFGQFYPGGPAFFDGAGIMRVTNGSVFDLGIEAYPMSTGHEGGGFGVAQLPSLSLDVGVLAGYPLSLVASSTGKAPSAAVVFNDNIPAIPATIVAGTNDQFGFDGHVYTVAPGSLATNDDLAGAINAAARTGGHRFDQDGVTAYPNPDGSDIIILANSVGTTLNGADWAIQAHDFLAIAGMVPGLDAMTGGTANGGDPSATKGSAILYLVTVTPA